MPQRGPQKLACSCPADIIFFGGTRGGGKSDTTIGRHMRGIEKYKEKWNGLVVRRKYKDLAELRHRIDEITADGWNAIRTGGEQQINVIKHRNGGQFKLAAIQNTEMLQDFIGHQYPEISIEEATTFPFFYQLIDKLKGSNRSPHGIPCHIFVTGNPGGPGHNDVKSFFKLGKDFALDFPPGRLIRDENGETKVYIPSFLDDNRILCENDPKYVNRLKSISNPALRKAWLKGDWDVYIGRAFEFSYERHAIEPIWPIPDYMPIYMTFDWGFGAPFAIGWWWVDSDGRFYRFAEWYGWNEIPNQGIRLEDSEIADGIMEKEASLGISDRSIMRLAGPDCFNKKPNYMGGGQGPSTATVFASKGLHLSPGDPSRALKIRQFRERLKVPKEPKEMPMMVVYKTCKQFIRTIPGLCMDDVNVEDIDTEQEDHCFDDRTEILTETGWKPFTDISKKDHVATMNQDNQVEYHNPFKIIDREFTGDLYAYDGRVNFKVTNGHRFPLISKHYHRLNSDKWDHKRVDSINDNTYLPRTAEWNPRVDKTLFKENHLDLRTIKDKNPNANNVDQINWIDFFKYYGFWLAEGCIGRGSKTHYAVHVDQNDDVNSIVGPLGYRYSVYKNKAGCSRYTIQSKQFYKLILELSGGCNSHNKYIPRFMLNAPSYLLFQLYDGMMLGDGSMNNNMPTYSTTSKQLADDFQELLFKLGKVGNIKKYEQKHNEILGRPIKSKVPYYRIHVFKNNTVMLIKSKITKEQYSGRVYCVSVPNETIYVRRAGTPYWSSNCYDEACHIAMKRPLEVDENKILQAKEDAKRTEARSKLDGTGRQVWSELDEVIKQQEQESDGWI